MMEILTSARWVWALQNSRLCPYGFALGRFALFRAVAHSFSVIVVGMVLLPYY